MHLLQHNNKNVSSNRITQNVLFICLQQWNNEPRKGEFGFNVYYLIFVIIPDRKLISANTGSKAAD
jgi:hypothetical protein